MVSIDITWFPYPFVTINSTSMNIETEKFCHRNKKSFTTEVTSEMFHLAYEKIVKRYRVT